MRNATVYCEQSESRENTYHHPNFGELCGACDGGMRWMNTTGHRDYSTAVPPKSGPQSQEGTKKGCSCESFFSVFAALDSIYGNCRVWQSAESDMSSGDFLDLIETIAEQALEEAIS